MVELVLYIIHVRHDLLGFLLMFVLVFFSSFPIQTLLRRIKEKYLAIRFVIGSVRTSVLSDI